LRFGVIDEIVPEPPGGSHTNHALAASLLDAALAPALARVAALTPAARLDARYRKWRAMGSVGIAEA
jgi:acetyl-CoA carboxylase alpha subunit